MTYDDYQFCRPYLVSGEHIIWKDKPGKGNLLTSSDAFMIPFSLVWCGFVFFWEYMALSDGAPFSVGLFGLPFIFIGLYLVLGSFIHLAYLRKRTLYVITNEKIIRKRGSKVDMLNIKNMPPAHVKIHKDGYGTISFQENSFFGSMHRMNSFMPNQMGFMLENIPNAVQVQKIISDLENC